MSEVLLPDIEKCVAAARAQGMRVVTRADGDDAYDEAREVKNARFMREPLAVAYCRSPEDVQLWFGCLESVDPGASIPVVVRSGGHQHEGRCVDDRAVVLDLSETHGVGEIDPESETVWIGSGTKLGYVNRTLSSRGYLLPVGGCSTVCAGGLTHGGGWGLSWRTHGLTVDHLVEADVVTSDGSIHRGIGPDKEPDLFWALRGGGGGNFGVVTRLRFKLTRETEITAFTVLWNHEALQDVASKWIEMMGDEEETRINSFCRLTMAGDEGSGKPTLRLVGWYYGTEDSCRAALEPLLSLHDPTSICIKPKQSAKQAMCLVNGKPEKGEALLFDSGEPVPAHAFALQIGAPGADGPESTCEGTAERHKVSSTFAKSGMSGDLVRLVDAFLESSDDIDGANLYVSLHGMGGQGGHEPNEGTAYPWRHKSFLVQIQAWWNDDVDDHRCVEWLRRFRTFIAGVTEGAFISFPDEEQALESYYGTRWEKLRSLKTKYDGKNRLRFAMSIPAT